MFRTRLLSILVATGLAACGPSAPRSSSKTTASGSPSADAEPGSAKLGLQTITGMSTIDGQTVESAPRATAIVVFASWCGNCQRELAHLAELREQYPKLRIIGLNAYEEFQNKSDKERLAAYVADKAPWLTEIVHADKALLAKFGGVPKIPTSFVYDSKGEVVAEFRRDQGKMPEPGELEAAIQTALAQ